MPTSATGRFPARLRRTTHAAIASAMSTSGITAARTMVAVCFWFGRAGATPCVVDGAGRGAVPGDGWVLLAAVGGVVTALNSARLFHLTGIAGAQISENSPTRTTPPSVTLVVSVDDSGVKQLAVSAAGSQYPLRGVSAGVIGTSTSTGERPTLDSSAGRIRPRRSTTVRVLWRRCRMKDTGRGRSSPRFGSSRA